MGWQNIALGGLTASGIIIGLSSWLGKVWANRILEKDRTQYQTKMETLLENLRKQASKELFVHELQFEKEFEIYKELWGQLIRLVPWVTSFDELLKPEHITQRAQELPNIIRDISHTVYTNLPFYPPEIFEACEYILNSMPKINTLNERLDKLNKYSSPEKSVDIFEKRYDELLQEITSVCKTVNTVSTLIRKRIWGETRDSGAVEKVL